MYPSDKSPTFGIFVKNQVELLRQKGLEVEILAIDNPGLGKRDLVKKYFFWFLKGFLFLFKGYKYDVCHVHYVFPSGLIGLFFKWIWKCKLIVTAHGGDIDKMAKKNRTISRWTFRILKEADHVIAVGERLYQEISSVYQVDKKKLSLLSMGVNREIFKPNGKKRSKIILFVGNIIPDKGVKELIIAYSMVKKAFSDTALYLIGPTKNKLFLEELHALIRTEQIKDVSFEGPLSQEKVSDWLNAAAVFVLPSYKEGFGLAALEAMACGTPVVGSDIGGLSYLLAEGCGVLVPPGNCNVLAEGITSVLQSEELREKLIANGAKRADEHDQTKIARKIMEIYGK
jgi:glycosyltransferase involved in cell wall biosynthesis